jgi:hypothetical protein
MAGGTPEHAALAAVVSAALLAQTRGGPCRVHSSDLRVRALATGLTTYPDVTVVCGPYETDTKDKNTVVNPRLLVESRQSQPRSTIGARSSRTTSASRRSTRSCWSPIGSSSSRSSNDSMMGAGAAAKHARAPACPSTPWTRHCLSTRSTRQQHPAENTAEDTALPAGPYAAHGGCGETGQLGATTPVRNFRLPALSPRRRARLFPHRRVGNTPNGETMMHALTTKNVGCRPSEWSPARPPSPIGIPALARSLQKGAAILATLAVVACVSNGSPPPAPSQEAPGESRALQPSVTPQPPVPAPPAQASPSRGSDGAPTADLKQQLGTLPDSVLMGTDVVPLADYLGSAAAIPTSGTFRSEQGGATAEVRLESGPKGTTLTREFTEPGTKPQTQRYDGLQSRAQGVRLSGPNLEVLGAAPGVLVLEKRSGVDGIPDSLWIEYARVPAGAPAKGK